MPEYTFPFQSVASVVLAQVLDCKVIHYELEGNWTCFLLL
jgi:hypothetical protein